MFFSHITCDDVHTLATVRQFICDDIHIVATNDNTILLLQLYRQISV